MDAGLVRAVASAAPVTVRTTEHHAAPTTTELPVQATVQQPSEAEGPRERDARAETHSAALQQAADERRRAFDRDAATGLTVMKVIEQRSGQVVDQVPTEAYLRMKIALRATLDQQIGRSLPNKKA